MYFESQNVVPTIYITQEARQKIELLTDICDGEVSALGKVSVKNGYLLIEEIFLLEQEVTGSTTDLSVNDVSKFLFDYIKSGKKSEEIKLWWHSHVRMDTFWSGTDQATINLFKNSGWMLSIVSNKYGKHRARLDIYDPVRIIFDNMELVTQLGFDQKMRRIVQKEVDTKVKSSFFHATVLPAIFGSKQTDTQPMNLYNRQPLDLSKTNPVKDTKNVNTVPGTSLDTDKKVERLPIRETVIKADGMDGKIIDSADDILGVRLPEPTDKEKEEKFIQEVDTLMGVEV